MPKTKTNVHQIKTPIKPKARNQRRRKVVTEAVPVPLPAAPEPVHQDVRQRAMLVNLTVHQWLASATDEKITDEVAQQHGIAAEMGRYQKNLLSKNALARLRSAGNKLRSTHNRYTLPWDEWGTRILSAKAFLDYNAALRHGIDEFDQIFREEMEEPGLSGKSKYEESQDEARRLLNGAFREDDYPTLETLRAKFRAKITVMPIPAGEDFRIDLGAEATAQVRQEIEAKASDRITEAMRGVYGRLRDAVLKLAVALQAEKTEAIRSTLFTSLNTVLEALPRLNITGDATLDDFAAEIGQLVSGLSAKELRESEPHRVNIMKRASAILDQMNDFLG